MRYISKRIRNVEPNDLALKAGDLVLVDPGKFPPSGEFGLYKDSDGQEYLGRETKYSRPVGKLIGILRYLY
ncbi:hypothetical protein VIBNISO65_830023 [Vibrio nigripulchritudo SO65]|uniref:hypothetical protein n=1 Tax=Vibrio nigripulchritudo TaxID=28173 RepID=UPI0003B228A1|nr:hypothetical protein [Vibrio nigripulchritudo]CCN38211.1 hypothetical protein VIBNIAM115_840023 [Vibrio nigripulchritudo AM115]CCN42689.1 hypothetical protein VIBNIFTn2_360023 [Vibrio nigripulchritudo FTn2]CCN79085.1 hypothetical protein VIBNISO65_830023 [Vibrio nigripulchritudo SO65]